MFHRKIRVSKSGDNIHVWIRQPYNTRGYKHGFRWVHAGAVSLTELEKAEGEKP